ncbi:MAG: site-2 protease family protein, partial [Patescibacteria group bacterium]
MFTALIFIAVIGVLVVVHEFGHFITAKKAGMKVEEFGFGFPPRLWGIKKGETTYSINLIPFGGFVKIFGEEGEHRNAPRSFSSKSIGVRLKVVIAGVVMNFLLAVFLLMVGNYFGIRVGIGDETGGAAALARENKVQIINVVSDSPAEKAGLKIFDEIAGFSIKELSGKDSLIPVLTAKEVREYVADNAGEEIKIVVRRNSETLTKVINLPDRSIGEKGLLGIVPARTGILSYPWHESVWRGVSDSVFLTAQTAVGYYQLFKTLLLHGKLIADVSGPIGIANVT